MSERERREALYRLKFGSINKDEFISLMKDLGLDAYDSLADYGKVVA